MSFREETKVALGNYFKARFPYVYIPTWEESRACELVENVAHDESIIKFPRKVYTWAQTTGMVTEDRKVLSNTKEPAAALEFVKNSQEDSVFIFKDLHVFFGVSGKPADYALIRKMRDLIEDLHESRNRKNVVLISPELIIPDDMQKEITVFEFPLPNVDEIMELLDQIIEDNALDTDLSFTDKELLAKAGLGLTLQEAENAFSRAIVKNRGLNKEAIAVILEEKNQVIKKSGILEFVNTDISIDDIGGLENLKSWLNKRNNSWMDSAKRYNLPAPKGVLITGVPGCGKSLTAKAMSAIWQLPLLKLDMGRIFSGIVGSSEQNMRRAIATAEAVAPSILWVDEVEKGFGGSTGQSTDSGTTTRIFGTFLTWMQEKTAPVFVIATANNINNLPPELLRKGRFDEIFFVDLPTENERKKIFEVHLKKKIESSDVGKNIQVNDELLTILSKLTEGFVGAEIEHVVITALYEAFFNNRDVTGDDLMFAIKSTVPLSVTQKEQIKSLREWADVRAVSATQIQDRQTYKTTPIKAPEVTTEDDDDLDRTRGGRMLDF